MTKNKGMTKKIVAGALVLAIAASGVCLLGYTSRDNDGNWFGGLHWADNGLDNGNGNGGPIISDGESNGMLLSATVIPLNSYEEYGVSPLAENAYNLNVTYTPSDTTFQETTYTIAFKNPSSTWAKGKIVTDYATIEQSAVGSKDAVLTVLKPFSEQIIVTATNNRNTAIKATTTVDYVCTTLNIDVVSERFSVGDDIYFTYSGWTGGTLTPETASTITFVYDVGSGFVSQAAAAGFTVNRYYSSVLGNPATGEDSDISCTSLWWIYTYGIMDYNSLSSTEKADYRQFLGRQFATYEDGDGCGSYGFSYKRIYNGVTYSTYDITQDSNAEWYDYDRGTDWSDYFEVVATSSSTNLPSIIVG